jgi:hypothetical protein
VAKSLSIVAMHVRQERPAGTAERQLRAQGRITLEPRVRHFTRHAGGQPGDEGQAE